MSTIEYESAASDLRGLEELPDHTGQPRTIAADFFVSPPAEIGPLVSAESTLRQGRREMPAPTRAILFGAIAVIVGLATMALADRVPQSQRDGIYVAGLIAAAIAMLIAWFATRFRHRCTYLGRDGAARFVLRGRRAAQPGADVLLFARAAELRAKQTRHFVNGVYSHTSYRYTWTDATGGRLYVIEGKYKSRKKPPKRGDAWHFAFTTEIAWSQHLLDRAAAQLQSQGSIFFNVDRTRSLRVGPGFIEFDFGGDGGPVRVTRDEIAGVSLGGGQFSFKHKDARWYSRAGKYSFSYGDMGNAKVFLLALDKLMGYRWS